MKENSEARIEKTVVEKDSDHHKVTVDWSDGKRTEIETTKDCVSFSVC